MEVMMGLQAQYFESMKAVLEKIEIDQAENVDKCAKAVCDSITNGGVFHIMDTGHMLMYEGVGRSGGLMSVRPLRVSVDVDNPVRPRTTAANRKKVFMDEIAGLPEYIIERGDVESGDVLLIGSVSGVKMLPVGLALAAKERNITTIALTSLAYSSSIAPKHPCGKRLFELTDYVLDNCSPAGDAMVYVEELGHNICPSSGIGASYVMWSLQARIVEIMLERGLKPAMYKNHNLPNAAEHNKLAWKQYEELGY
jgi:uncharacterized phosphosugar-binding protein